MKATLFAVALPLLLAGCASPSPLPEVLSSKTPIKSGAKVPKAHHHTTLTGYTHREPVLPDAWAPEDTVAAPESGEKPVDCKKMEGAPDDCPAQ